MRKKERKGRATASEEGRTLISHGGERAAWRRRAKGT